MDKIIITGGLGYIGSELCKLYSGEARFKEIIVLDSRFVSERVKQITDWGMQFIQGSILDDVLMKKIMDGATLIYHLAGVTDVAYTKSGSNTEKDKEIKECGVDATRIIMNHTPPECKIIFPSTHVVYEGLIDTKFNIEEHEAVSPILTYATSKVQSEIDLQNSNLNYIIVRLGSVYGYSTDTMRMNIMPNLFSKITSQNGTISLFSGGVQYKSLIGLIDVVRSMKFLGESNINREIFHLRNENMTIKEVAELCKKFNPNVNIVETNDEIPNLGYTLCNKKLLSTGFKFQYNIEKCVSEMIKNWSKKDQPDELEYIIEGGKEYIDDRGKISNYELPEPINLIGYIESKSGSVRANHYHPIQEQKCLLVSGKYISVIKDLSKPNCEIETRIIKAGDIAVIRPNVAHAMVFLEDSIFLNLVRGEREHENYGITHTIPYLLVDENFRNSLIKNYKVKCRSCESENLKNIVSLGMSPLANNLLSNIEDEVDMYPLEIKHCQNCQNVQLSFVVPPKKMFDNYLYVSSTTESFKKHFKTAAYEFIQEFKLDINSLVVDIGSNDGIFLNPMKEMGIRVVGVEPAKNISDIANNNGIETINDYFNQNVADQIVKKHGKANIVTSSNVFAHSDDLVNMAKITFNSLLKDGGSFIIEVQYLLDTIKDMTFDNIYHEHVNYWSVTSLSNFFKNLGLSLYKVKHIDTHGGSIRAYVRSKFGDNDDSIKSFLQAEEEFGISNHETYKNFAKRLKVIKSNVLSNMNLLKSKFGKIAAYGSPAKATTALNYFGIDNTMIDYTIEDNLLKVNRFIPGVNIPIKNKEYCFNNLPNVIIVLAWNFFEDIKKNNKELVDKGVIFLNIKDLQNDEISI